MNAKRMLLAILAIFALTSAMVMAQDQAAKPKTKTKTSQSKTTKSETKESMAAKAGPKLDINSASKEDLEKLPGIGPATSQKIVDGRPYRNKHELVSKKIVSQSEYDKIKNDVVAHQEKPATAKKKK